MLITDLDALQSMVDDYLTRDAFAIDVETVGGDDRANPRLNRVTWISFATDGRADVLPLGHANGEFRERIFDVLPSGRTSTSEKKSHVIWEPPPFQLRIDDKVRAILRPLLFSTLLKVGHNIKFDVESLAKHFDGDIMPGPFADTLVAAFVIDQRHKGQLGLERCTYREIEYAMVKGVGKNVLEHSFDDVARYAFLDVRYTWLLWKALLPQLAVHWPTWSVEMDVLPCVIDMETNGIKVDVRALTDLDALLRASLEEAEAACYRAAGRPFNVRSQPEKVAMLYGKKTEGGQGLRVRKRTNTINAETGRGNPSVDDQALSYYAGENALVDAIIAYSDLQKLHGTYVLPYLGGITSRTTAGKTKTIDVPSLLIDGRIHCSFNQCPNEGKGGTETGRFSSSNPNLQNIPSRGPMAKQIRRLFIADEGEVLIVADYAQVEPRVMAEMSKDPRMLKAFDTGEDIYETLASPFGLTRAAGKLLVLSVGYGTGPATLANAVDITLEEAEQVINVDFPRQFKVLMQHKAQIIQESRSRRPCYSETLLGRRRYLPELFSREKWQRDKAERQAYNAVVQGTAADINKMALVNLKRTLPPECKVLLTVHDEIVASGPASYSDELAGLVKASMEGVTLLKRVPLIAETKVALTWAEGK